MLLTSLSHKILKNYFSDAYFQRGYDYFRHGYVSSVEIEEDLEDDNVFITANVRGSGRSHYKVAINLDGPLDDITIDGDCTCPMGYNCKHVVATLLQAMSNTLQAKKTNTRTPVTITQHATPVPQPVKKDARIEMWLQQLKIASIQSQAIGKVNDSYQLHYIFYSSRNNPKELQLNLELFRYLKSGKLGASKTFNENNDSHRSHLFSIDEELLVKLEVAKRRNREYVYSSNMILKGAAFEKLLPELIATQRCHFQATSQAVLQLAPPQKMELKWHLNEDGSQEMRPFFPNASQSLAFFQIEQLWYINTFTSELGLIETDHAPQLAMLLLSSPPIPPEATEEIAKRLADDIKIPVTSIPSVLSVRKVEQVKPVACLRLFEADIFGPGNRQSDWKTIPQKRAVAQFHFRYQNAEIAWNDERELVPQVKNQALMQFARDLSFEDKAIRVIAKYNVIPIQHLDDINHLSANAPLLDCLLVEHSQCKPLEFSLYALPELRAQGWQIEIDPEYPYQIMEEEIDEWYSKIEEGSGYDWFGLELGIAVKGEKINLIPILHDIFKELRANNNELDSTKMGPVLVKLPNGKFIPLPFERIHNIVKVLIELYDSQSLTEDNLLKLSQLHALRLLELEAAMGAAKMRWFGGKKLLALAKKLSEFKGIKTISVPKTFQGELRHYQQDGLNWLQFLREYEFGGILADDMGLGKTIQALSHIAVEKHSKRMNKPSLVIAPTSLMFNWSEEAKKFAPQLKILVLHGAARKGQYDTISEHDLVLTTYPLLIHDKEVLLKHDFHLLILDEAQNIKNSKSLSAQIVQQIKAKHRLCLTGTPLENHLGELWSLFHFMMPGLLGEEKTFNRLFRIPIEKHGNQERREHLSRRIAPFLLRRTKNNVVKELPEKVHILQHVELEGAQRDLYETIRVTMEKKIRQEIAKMGLARSHIIILDALLKLRQICCDPRLLKINSAKKAKAKSAKLELLMSLLPELIEEGRRILLFSQFTGMLELIEAELTKQKIKYVKLTGQTKDRATPIQKFQQGDISLFLISLKAGGTGLNLTAADTVIHYDPWWNPAVEDQATDRAHRIGQNKTVFVYKFVTKGTVEEKILEMQQNKRALMDGLFSGKTTGKVKLTEKDLQGFFEPLE